MQADAALKFGLLHFDDAGLTHADALSELGACGLTSKA